MQNSMTAALEAYQDSPVLGGGALAFSHVVLHRLNIFGLHILLVLRLKYLFFVFCLKNIIPTSIKFLILFSDFYYLE